MPIDILVLVIVVVVSFFAIMYFGKSSGVSAVLSFYPSLLVYNNFPYFEKILSFARNPLETTLLKMAFFILLFLLSYITLRRAVSVVFSWTPIIKLFESIVLSIILSGLLFSVYIFIAGNSHFVATPLLLLIFGTAEALFWWLSGSMVVLLFTLKR